MVDEENEGGEENVKGTMEGGGEGEDRYERCTLKVCKRNETRQVLTVAEREKQHSFIPSSSPLLYIAIVIQTKTIVWIIETHFPL